MFARDRAADPPQTERDSLIEYSGGANTEGIVWQLPEYPTDREP